MYLIIGNRHYQEGDVMGYSPTKSNANKVLRASGYRFNAEQKLFLTDTRWASIELVEPIEKSCWIEPPVERGA
ncbi:MAG: hypothetical protein PHD39_09165 [Methylobacter tundripaludum]|nr:hypothetical protein [Methylobacter tundripaludum]